MNEEPATEPVALREEDLPPSNGEEEQGDTPEAVIPKKQPLYFLFTIVAVLIVVAVIILVEKPSDFEEYIRKSGYTGVLLMGIIGSTSPIWPLPGSWAAFIAGGLGLNPFLLGLAAGFGEPLGELTAFSAGYGGQVTAAKWKRYEQIKRWMTRHGTITIFLVSAIPNNLTKLVVIAAGTLRYPWVKFFLVCWAGKTIKSFCFALAGAGLFHIVIDILRHFS